MKDYYGILEVNEKASPEIIEKAYRTLVKKYHPDLYSSIEKIEAEKKLKDINEAYNILSDSFLRSQYDLELEKERNRIQMNNNAFDQNAFHQNTLNQNIQNYQQNVNQKRTENISGNKRKKQKTEYVKNKNKNNVGTIFGLVDLVKDLWANKPPKGERKKMDKTDWLAVGLTIVALLILGVILWFIPFTNGWMRQLLFENPIFNFIGGLFS